MNHGYLPYVPTLYLFALESAPLLWLALNRAVQSFPLHVSMMLPPGCRKELMSKTEFPTRTYPLDLIVAAVIPVPVGAVGVLPFPDPLPLPFPPLFFPPLFFPPLFFPPLFFPPFFFFFIKSLPMLGSTSMAMTSRVANTNNRSFFEGIIAWYSVNAGLEVW